MLTCSRIVDEFTTNSLLSLSVTILTRAQQLLRWATGWPQRHGPKSGGGCCASFLWESWIPINTVSPEPKPT